MKKVISTIFLSLFIFGCSPAPTPQVVVITVVVSATAKLATNTPSATPTPIPTFGTLFPIPTFGTPFPTANPCLLWSQVTSELNGRTVCVHGLIQKINVALLEGKFEVNGVYLKNEQTHWDFSTDRTGFFTVSKFPGWHPTTGKSIVVGDCVAVTGEIHLLSNGRLYIYWGTKSTAKVLSGNNYYFEHPELQVFEDKSLCE